MEGRFKADKQIELSGIAAGGIFYNYQRELQLSFVLVMKLGNFCLALFFGPDLLLVAVHS